MEEKIKDIEVIAYKGIELDMSCGDFHQYEIGKTYKTDKAELWKCGFHACLNPIDVLDYYSQEEGSHYYKVKLSGEITQCDFDDTEVTATEVTILEEINIDEILNTTEWWKHENVLDLLYWSDGFAVVQRSDRKYNYIDKQGKLLSEQWFAWAGIFYQGFARVKREDKLLNLINKDGKILSEQWFDWISGFYDGFSVVGRGNHEYNYIDKQGKIISSEWFKWLDYFHNGFASVQRFNDEFNFLDKQGKLLSNEWFKYVDYFDEYDLAKVQRTNGEWAKIDKNGKIVSE